MTRGSCRLYGIEGGGQGKAVAALSAALSEIKTPWAGRARVGIKLHWGERGNHSYLPPAYARQIVRWLHEQGQDPFVFDTTVLYSGGRRNGEEALQTASRHGYTPEFLGCPVVIADGLDGRDVCSLPADFHHFQSVQVAAIIEKADGFVIFSHFKGHLAAGFGGALKNLSMGFASRAQKQRMHADVHPVLRKDKCSRCGVCVEVCPAGAATIKGDDFPAFDRERCIGCAQCIALCPEMALRILWGRDKEVFQEKLVETAAALWPRIEGRSVLINALLTISAECDCLPGEAQILTSDRGFMTGEHPVTLDRACLDELGEDLFDRAHPGLPWRRQLAYAREIGFGE